MKIRISDAISKFKERVLLYWSLKEWDGIEDLDQDVLFFGLYNDRDYDAFRIHNGKKSMFWCGGDILWLQNNWNYQRIMKLFPDTEHYCENEVEAKNLEKMGIKVKMIVPSFLDNVNNFPVSYKHSKTPHIFMCGHDEREEEYGLDFIKEIAPRVPDTTFHIYGISTTSPYISISKRTIDQKLVDVDSECFNIWYHGKVSEEQFNNEIMNYQCGLRTNEHDGFSEVTSKSLLLGQYPISKISYEKIWSYKTGDELVALIDKLKYMKEPNYDARSFYLKRINNFPWCRRKYWNRE